MRQSNIPYVLLSIGLVVLLAACSSNQEPTTDIPSPQSEESVVMNESLGTLALESSNELTFLSPLTSRLGVYALLRAGIQVSIEFFAVENGQVVPTPLGPSLSTRDGSLRVNNSRPRYSNYSAAWNTGLSNRQNGDIVRAEVRLGNAPTGAPACSNGVDKNNGCLGFFDVQLWNSSWDVFYRRWFQYDDILDIRNRGTLPIKFHIAQGTDIPTGTPNTVPTISITAPSNNATFSTNDTITLTARANDVEDGNISNTIQWSSNNVTSSIPNGATVQLGKLAAGSYTFTAKATDSRGASKEATVRFTVTAPANNSAPTLNITNPNDNATFTTSDSVTLTAVANDAEDGNISNSIQWTSNNGGNTLPNGARVQLGQLAAGSYTFTARVRDSNGASAQDSVTFTVTATPTNTAPTVSISNPSNGATFTSNNSITLSASANDAEDGNLSNSIQWSSNNFSATIPNGANVQLGTLAAGTYTFTARVRDSNGASAQDSVTFTVTAPTNTAPTLTITSPSNNTTFTTNNVITLTATANDAQDGNLSNSIQWSSNNFSATIPNGGNVRLGTLAAGTYTFTARVRDSNGVAAQDSVTFTVNEPIAPNNSPILTITNPRNGASFTSNDSITLVATANDKEDGNISANIRWSSNDFSGALPNGGSVALGKLAAGSYTFVATVSDNNNAGAETSVTFTVAAATNTAPVLTITSPSNNQAFTSTDSITLVATANDAQDGNISSTIQWSSNDFSGAIAQGGTVNLGRLAAGGYTFTARVTDSNGASAEQSVRFGVTASNGPNTPPTVTITSPVQGDSLTVNDSITLVATANDAQDGNISANIQWVAEQGYTGTLTAGPQVALGTLSAGTYTFAARVTDSQGATTINRITFPIVAANGDTSNAPRIEILSPAENPYNPFTSNTDIILEAKATDTQDGDLSQRVQWSSNDYQGTIPAGGRVNIGKLPVGRYTFTATVTDSQGNRTVASITFSVQSAVIFGDVPSLSLRVL